jgi:hypothetical protein
LVIFKLTVEPDEAKVFLDDVKVEKPYTKRFQKDGSSHRLRVEAEGFSAQTTYVEFSNNIDKTIKLEKEQAPEPKSNHVVRGGGRIAAPPPKKNDPPTSKTGGNKVDPGGAMPTPTKTKSTTPLDTSDPWKK